MLCDPGSVIWVKFIEIGLSTKYANDGKGAITCPREERASCFKSTAPQNLYENIGFYSAYGLTVPGETVTCKGEETPVNYIHLTFCCIERKCLEYQRSRSKYFLEKKGFYLLWVIPDRCM